MSAAAAAGGLSAGGLSAGGWVFLLLAWTGIAVLTAYCFYKVFGTRDRSR